MAENCVGLENLSLGFCEDQDSMGGITPWVIAGYYDEVDSWPDKPEATADESMDFKKAGEWEGDLVMKAGKKAVKIEFTDDTGLLEITDQGDKGAISFLYTLTMIFALMRSPVFGFENATKHRKMFFIVQDSNGRRYLMGDKNRGATRDVGDGATTGTATSDRNQSSVKFSYPCTRKLIYTGDAENLLTAAPGG